MNNIGKTAGLNKILACKTFQGVKGDKGLIYQRCKLKTATLHIWLIYGGTKVTWKIYFILRAHAVANTCARNN